MDKQLQDNDRKLASEVSGETFDEELLLQIEDCVEVVAIQNPYTPAQIFSISMLILPSLVP